MKKLFLHFLALSLLFGIFANQTKAQVSYQDSINLVSFYDLMGGDKWTNKTGWKTQPVKLWFGITVEAATNTITEINLPKNNLSGEIANNIYSIYSLKVLNLSENNITGSISWDISYLSNLEILNLSSNTLKEVTYNISYLSNIKTVNLSNNELIGSIPNFSNTLTDLYLENNEFSEISNFETLTLTNCNISNNNLTFEDLLFANCNASTFTYWPQKTVPFVSHKAQAAPDYPLNINIQSFNENIYAESNYYTWFKNGSLVFESSNLNYSIANLTANDLGTYYCKITNASFPLLTLQTENIEVGYLVPDAGVNDTVCNDYYYLSGNEAYPYIGTWTSQGSASISNTSTASTQADNLEMGDNTFRWSFNSNSDDVVITRLPNLYEETISAGEAQTFCEGQNFATITATDPSIFGNTAYGQWHSESGMYEGPTFDNPTSYTTTVRNLQVGNNYLYWSVGNNCSSNSGNVSIFINPKPIAWAGEDIYTGAPSTYLNAYMMNGENKKEVSKNGQKNGDYGYWTTEGSASIVEPTNTNTPVTNLSIGKNIFYWNVTSIDGCTNLDTVIVTYKNHVLAQDSLALVALFDATAGNNWTNRTNWKKTEVKNWYGVSVDENFNITSINLSENNLTGTLPTEFGKFSFLSELDLSYNNLSGKIEKTVVEIPTLTNIWVNNNKFSEFPAIERNKSYYNFNISYNNLAYTDFEGKEKPSAELFIFAPQNPIELTKDTFQTTVNSKVILNLYDLSIKSLTTAGTEFQWLYKDMPIENSAMYSGAKTAILTLNSVTLSQLGEYACCITHPEMQELSLKTKPIKVKFDNINAGKDQYVCENSALLNAVYPIIGTWTTYGNASIANPTSASTPVSGLDPGANIFLWSTSLGEDEVIIYNNSVEVANAGADIETCDYEVMLLGNSPQMGFGVWTSTGSATLETYTGSISTFAYNLAEGDNEFIWTIKNQNCISSDAITVKNIRPTINAGNDINIFSEVHPIQATDVNLKALPVPNGYTGTWSTYVGGVTIQTPSNNNTLVTGLQAGETTFKWHVKNNNSSCDSYDYVTVSIAYHIKNGKEIVEWNNPEDWTPNVVPTLSDSVSLSNCTVNVFGISAYFRSLHIGSSTLLWVKENLLTKSEGSLSGGRIVIEQDVEKKNKGGNGTLQIGSGGRVVIEQDVEKGSTNNKKGITVGSGGRVIIEQDVEKGTKSNPAIFTVRSGDVVVEETDPSSINTALIQIGNGGEMILKSNYGYGKDAKFNTNPNLKIGSGGEVVIEQDVEKGKALAAITLGSGGRIVIEQDVEKKSKATTGTLRISGGSVVIEQDVEKTSTTDTTIPSVLIGTGGQLIIEPNIVTGTLSAPLVKVSGGILNVGNAKKGNGKGKLSSGRVVIEQDVEKKSSKATPDMTVFGNGILEFVESSNTSNLAFINIGKDMALTFNTGADIIFPNITNVAVIETKENSSVIDHAGVMNGNIICFQEFTANTIRLISPPVKGSLADVFNNSELKSWGEVLAQWSNFPLINILNPVQGFKVMFPTNQTIQFEGTSNVGLQNVTLKNTLLHNINMRGFNLVGNPFTAAIDWESVYTNTLESAVYTYNDKTQNIDIYQRGGYSLNGADQYIDASEGFFVKALPTSVEPNISISPDNIIHNILGLVTKTPYKTSEEGMKLSVSNANYSDQIMIRLDATATMAYDEGLDVFKYFTFNADVPQLYTLGSNNEELAINVTPNPIDNQTTKTIALNFKSAVSGTYTINVDEFTFTDKYFHLKDLKTGTITDLRTVKTYQFEWLSTESTSRFQLLYNTTVGINDVSANDNFKIYAHKNNVYVSVNELSANTNVQIYSITGTKVFESNITKQGISEFALNQAAGNYLVKVVSDKNTMTQKVFITND